MEKIKRIPGTSSFNLSYSEKRHLEFLREKIKCVYDTPREDFLNLIKVEFEQKEKR